MDPEKIKILVRQAARWSTAAQQDQSPLIAFLHACYGVAYSDALRQVTNDMDIKAAAGLDVPQFLREITNVQDAAARKLVQACPNIAPPGNLAVIAQEAFGCWSPRRRSFR